MHIPYVGKSANLTFNGNKTLDAVEPGTKQFAFVMQQFDENDPLNDDGWENKREKEEGRE